MRYAVVMAFGISISSVIFAETIQNQKAYTKILVEPPLPHGLTLEKRDSYQLASFDQAEHVLPSNRTNFTPSGRLPPDINSSRDSSSGRGNELSLWGRAYLDTSIGMSQRSGNLSWSIASDISGKRAPNVLSELSYDGLQIRGLELQSRLLFVSGMFNDSFLEARIHRGAITGGETRDSDYNGNNKTQEYSRSLSQNTGDYVADYSLAYGHSWVRGESFSADVLAGYSLHKQFVRKQDAINVVSESGVPEGAPIEGLNSTYQSEWQGPWFGATLSLQGEQHKFKLQGEVHSALYYAEANWNLRDSFMHPKSFEHNATGYGWVLDVSYAYTFNFSPANKTTLGVSYRAEAWAAEDGLDKLYLASGEVVSTKLNEVAWGGDAVSIYLKIFVK